MPATLQDTRSLWMETARIPRFSRLGANTEADVCIVGAGIAGLTTALRLAEIGKSVLVLDQAEIGGGETGLTSAQISNAIDIGYAEVEHLHGDHGAKLAAQSHTAAIDWISETIQ